MTTMFSSVAFAGTSYAPGTSPVTAPYTGNVMSVVYDGSYFSMHIQPSACTYMRSQNNYGIVTDYSCWMLNWMYPKYTNLARVAPTTALRNSIGTSMSFAAYCADANEKNADGSIDVTVYYSDMQTAVSNGGLTVYIGPSKHVYKVIWVNGVFDPSTATYMSLTGNYDGDNVYINPTNLQIVLCQSTATFICNYYPELTTLAGILATVIIFKAGSIKILQGIVGVAMVDNIFSDGLSNTLNAMTTAAAKYYNTEKSTDGSLHLQIFWSDLKKSFSTGSIVIYVGTHGHEYLYKFN